jgi:hypothetical protein
MMEGFFKTEKLAKGDYHSRQGGQCWRLSFVSEGLLRMYRLHDDRDITHWISGPSYFATDLNSFLYGESCRWEIQALSEVKMQTISKADYDRMAANVPDWKHYENQFLAKCFAILEERMFAQLSLSAAERYAVMMAQQPNLIREVPLHYLASMLGMKPETLSRVRRKLQE